MSSLDSPIKNKLDSSIADTHNGPHNLPTLLIIVCVLCTPASASLFLLSSGNSDWQLIVLGAVYAICAGTGLIAIKLLLPKQLFQLSLIVISIAFGLAMIGTSAFLTGLGYPVAVVYLIFVLIISSHTKSARTGNLISGLGIIISGISVLFNDFSPFTQLNLQLVSRITPIILGFLFLFFIILLVRQAITTTLRTRLVTIFLAIVLIPLALLSIFQSQFISSVLIDETNKVLLVTAQQTAREIDDFITSSRQSLESSAQEKVFKDLLELPSNERQGSAEIMAARLVLEALHNNMNVRPDELTSYALLDLEGMNLFDTYLDNEERNITSSTLLAMGVDPERFRNGERPIESDQDYFIIPARSEVPYISPFILPNSTKGFFIISEPVRNGNGQVIGVLRVRYDGMILQNLLRSRVNSLGVDTYPVLFDENNIRLADTFTPQYLYKSVAPLSDDQVKNLKQNRRLPDLPVQMLSTNYVEFNEILNNYQSEGNFTTEISTQYETNQLKEIGAIAKMNTMPWKVVYLQTNYSHQTVRKEQSKLTTLITSFVGVIVGLIALGSAHIFSAPIIQLAKTAQKISEGDLEASVPFHGTDEYGMLGRTFNSMTSQLRTLITQLEARVRSRTQEIEKQNEILSQRARQLETVSQVARQIVSSQELEPLLSSVTHLISERFGFYHVGIFLIDNRNENAILRAANSQGGQKMLARKHLLPVGKVGIVGFVTGTGQPRIATDVGKDAVFFNNPDLPQTRSEMALPLKVGMTIIGALDIQSTESDAFHDDEIELFTILADQVAIAIYNNQLYMETLKALDEAQNLHRQYLQSEWAKETSQRKVIGYHYRQNDIFPKLIDDIPSGEIFNQELSDAEDKESPATVAVPIIIRGETIGVIQVQDQGTERLWSEEDIRVMNNIANQIGTALENARLFENAVRRADREKKAAQITARIRATNDPNEMLQIAANELKQALSATRAEIKITQKNESLWHLKPDGRK